jgi:hypothetical protein
MDLSRLPALRPQTPSAPKPARDVSAAQRAFFQAALAQTAQKEPAPQPKAVAEAHAEAAAPRIPRPGSIIDIRV